MASPRPTVALQPPERIFQASVVKLARLCGFVVFHERDSRSNTAGLPDLLLVKPPRAIYAELKRENGRVRPAQAATMAALRECGLDVRLWRPSDWNEIVETLQHKEATHAD